MSELNDFKLMIRESIRPFIDMRHWEDCEIYGRGWDEDDIYNEPFEFTEGCTCSVSLNRKLWDLAAPDGLKK